MDPVMRRDIVALIEADSGPCISIFQSSHPSAPESHQDPISFRKLLKDADEQLRVLKVGARQRQELLAPGHQLERDAHFWTHQARGLAVYLGKGGMKKFRLPMGVDEEVHVAEHFAIRPLLPVVQSNGRFFVLAASHGSCRFFAGNQYQLVEMKLEDLPKDLESALQWEYGDQELNLHSSQRMPQDRGADSEPMYHGHTREQEQVELAAYFRQIDAALVPVLREETAPLLFAGLPSLLPAFREANSYRNLLKPAVEGSPDRKKPHELHQEAWQIMQSVFKQQQEQAGREFSERFGKKRSTDQLERMVRAACTGMVDTLAIAQSAAPWGRYDGETGRIAELDPPSEDGCDLLELAARETFRNGGRVLVMPAEELPSPSMGFALLRAPVDVVASGAP